MSPQFSKKIPENAQALHFRQEASLKSLYLKKERDV